jgi:hypothetical protein
MQHLVGAKLEGVFPGAFAHNSSSTKDEGQKRPAVTMIGRCPAARLAWHLRIRASPGAVDTWMARSPIEKSPGRGVGLAVGLAENAGIAERLDVFDVEQWLATDILDRAGDVHTARGIALEALLTRYNAIVEAVETDPSLRIEAAAAR